MMTQVSGTAKPTTHSGDLLDDVRESAKVGQHAVAEALRLFRQTVDEAVPDAVQPLRNKIVDAAIELADQLVAAQYQFNRNLVRSADRALSRSDGEDE
jgi:truncated hemoglobin YjbI